MAGVYSGGWRANRLCGMLARFPDAAMNELPRTPSLPIGDNPYAPPQAIVADGPARAAAVEAPFHIVSPAKAAALTIATSGLYGVYWYWRHWSQHKRALGLDIWPVPRALFMIFFAHSLNHEIDHRLRREGLRYAWSPNLWATVYVIASIGARILDRLPDEMTTPRMVVGALIVILSAEALAIHRTQRAANFASGDPEARANRRLTVANGIWLGLGAIFWALLLIGALLPPETSA